MDPVNKKILIDIGSSTVKVYERTAESVTLSFTRSIPFKKEVDPLKGISESCKNELYELISEVKHKNSSVPIRLFATAVFRKLEDGIKRSFVDEFFLRTGLYFNIVSHELESFYLQVGLVGKYRGKDPILLINVGGGSTELVVMYGNESIESANLDLGVGSILTEFPTINDSKAGITLETVKKFVGQKLPSLGNKARVAVYSGGELNFMQLAGYNLTTNKLFQDTDHPLSISFENFSRKNKEIFERTTLQELESLMPDNPSWMHGARACSAITQAICEKYEIETIVPSDSNLVNGVNRQEFRHVTISGSFRKHLNYILKVRKLLVDQGVEVMSPRFSELKNPGEEFVVFSGEEGVSPLELERYHLNSISLSDALVVCDPEGYVGASALIEIGHAQSLGKKIVFTEKPEEFMLNTLPAEIGL